MRWLIGILLFLFLAPICILAGFFGSCLMVSMTSSINAPNSSGEALMVASLFAGPLIGLAGSIALVILLVRTMFPERPVTQ